MEFVPFIKPSTYLPRKNIFVIQKTSLFYCYWPSVEIQYLMTRLNLSLRLVDEIHRFPSKSESPDFNEIHSHLLDLNRETSKDHLPKMYFCSHGITLCICSDFELSKTKLAQKVVLFSKFIKAGVQPEIPKNSRFFFKR